MKKNINGVILLDKPYGISSNQALGKIRRILNTKKVGHTGTLDPLATGLLPVCLGEATKFTRFLLEGDKEYVAKIKFGLTTTTCDLEGEITSQREVAITLENITQVLTEQFEGEITQIPPIYSAIKYQGRPLYEYAREQIEVPIKPRVVKIYIAEILAYDEKAFILTLRLKVSAGTYIRSLARDLGEVLSCGGVLTELRRIKTNQFELKDAYSLDAIERLGEQVLLPINTLTKHLNTFKLNLAEYQVIKYGNLLKLPPDPQYKVDELLELWFEDKFLGVGCFKFNSQLGYYIHPQRLVV